VKSHRESKETGRDEGSGEIRQRVLAVEETANKTREGRMPKEKGEYSGTQICNRRGRRRRTIARCAQCSDENRNEDDEGRPRAPRKTLEGALAVS